MSKQFAAGLLSVMLLFSVLDAHVVVNQTFADGSMRHWIGERGSKEPASVTTLVPKGTATTSPAAEHKH